MSFKKIFSTAFATLIVFIASAQAPAGSYNAAWKRIDSLINKLGYTASAMAEVNKLYDRAKKENNNVQVIKALIVKMQLNGYKQENVRIKNIELLEKEIPTAAEPARSILQNISAKEYLTYYQLNRYRLYNRSATINFNKDDVATWSVDDFHNKISSLFLSSIKNEKLLQQTRLNQYDPIIIKGNVRFLRPTLYDLLVHEALQYFKNDEVTITKPAYSFEINDPAAFADAAAFANHKFVTQDTISLQYRALQLYQKLIRFHLNDAKPDALVDVDIHRVLFVNSGAFMENKDELYKKALEQIVNKYPDLPVAANAWFYLANWYADKARPYDPPGDTVNRYAFVQAKAICERVAAQKDSSEGWAACKNLLHEITRPELHTETEKVNEPGKPFRVSVRWKNFTQLHFRLVKIDNTILERINGSGKSQDETWEDWLALPVYKTFSRNLPDTRDYQHHRAEISVDSLPVGQYALLASTDAKFDQEKSLLAFQHFHVSNIAWINKHRDYYVLHRQTGKPIPGANVQVWYRVYNNNTRTYINRKGENVIAGSDGNFKLSPPSANTNLNNFKLEVRTKDDHLFISDYLYDYPEPKLYPQADSKVTFLFTDRSIYRPGQTIYFKGIVINKPADTDKSTIAPGYSTTIYLYDVNRQKLDSAKVTTNEFGSYSAKFTIPLGQLNGQFSIEDNNTNTQTYVSVEEYKRPRFSTEIEQPSGTYRLNDTIKVTGNAKAYAGNNIDGATVKYRVTRTAIFPLWFYGYRKMIWPPYPQEQMEIAHGETTTDANGNYIIAFKAIPDNSIPKKNQPTFRYEVTADVTDNAGETRSGATVVSVGWQALQLNIDMADELHKDSLKTIKLSSKNLADKFEKTTVNVGIYKLQAPNRLFRERYWAEPDTFTMSKEEYYRLFPYDLYADELNPAKWARGEKLVDITDTTSASEIFSLKNAKLPAGWYVIEAITKDKYGEEVKALKYIQLFDQVVEGPGITGRIETVKAILQPGEKATYRITTNVDSTYIIHEIGKKENQETRNISLLTKNGQNFEIPVTENDRGGMGVSFVFVKHNRVFSETQLFDIPYSNKQLSISYATYRDKTLPGSQEKWTVKISGYKGEKAATEMLTAMYDASLDQFRPHSWNIPSLWSYYSPMRVWGFNNCFGSIDSWEKYLPGPNVQYNHLYDILMPQYSIRGRSMHMRLPKGVRDMALAEKADVRNYMTGEDAMAAPQAVAVGQATAADRAALSYEHLREEGAAPAPPQGQPQPQVRKNFNETAFFFPDLKTDSAGNITFSFTMPDAVTQWKWMSLAHTKELAFAYAEKNVVTQKDLMVQPNAPRFLREGDRMDFSTKIANITNKEMTGQVELQLIDPSTGTSVDGWFQNMFPNQYFTVGAGQSAAVNFTIQIPFRYNKPVTYRLIARSGNTSDGEEAILPVVSNRLLVTESMPLPLRGGQTTKSFKFDKLLQSGNSQTLNHHALTVEFTSNPAWYAVQSLPYLMEYPYECSEQIFNRYYANTLASTIANTSPRIKEIFQRWKTLDTAALMSNLQKNQELKSILLEETPWVLQAKSESEQKKNIALLFDMVRMSTELKSALGKLKNLQTSNGGFAWFAGGPDDRFITQYILTGIGHLKKLNALTKDDGAINNIIRTAMPYLDNRIVDSYNQLVKLNKGVEPTKGGLGYYEIQYLYMRSFHPDISIPATAQKAISYFRKQAQLNWLSQNKYMQGMIALALHRTGAGTIAKTIATSIKQNALYSEEMGMYWAQNNGYYWYQAAIETQALLIEVFTEVTADSKSVNDMKTWLLKQKQTQNWRSTKATADAVYALLLQGKDWLTNTPEVTIQLGANTIRSNDQAAEAGTGYFKKTIDGNAVKPDMGNVQVFIKAQNGNTPTQPSWGSVYWQYFEEMDKITAAATPLKLAKKLFVEKNTDRGPVLQPLNEGDALKVGDKVKVRIELRSDRTMEYVHMKDMRAACMEPVNVISSYKWQGGLGYYETTKDASTNFFFSYLPKGTFVFEYTMFVTHTGTFSNGITSIQCMYAPEFASHSEGVKVRVE